jgi:hypothetical protein
MIIQPPASLPCEVADCAWTILNLAGSQIYCLFQVNPHECRRDFGDFSANIG